MKLISTVNVTYFNSNFTSRFPSMRYRCTGSITCCVVLLAAEQRGRPVWNKCV